MLENVTQTLNITHALPFKTRSDPMRFLGLINGEHDKWRTFEFIQTAVPHIMIAYILNVTFYF